MRYNAMMIAKWFAAWAEQDEADLCPLKVQKLLYFAQGHHLQKFGTPLFGDTIEAWAHGPVVPAVYHAFKGFGSSDIRLDDDDEFWFEEVDDDTTQFLMGVWNSYAKYAAWTLRNMTHEAGPWKDVFQRSQNAEISVDAMRSHFSRLA